jgi:hypothetical protein
VLSCSLPICAGEVATESDVRSAPAAQQATDTDGGADGAEAPAESHTAPALVVQNDGGLRREARYQGFHLDMSHEFLPAVVFHPYMLSMTCLLQSTLHGLW